MDREFHPLQKEISIDLAPYLSNCLLFYKPTY